MSTVERVSQTKQWLIRSRLSDPGLVEQSAEYPDPKKPANSARSRPGSGTAKAVVTSRAVTVHASTLGASSQKLAARA